MITGAAKVAGVVGAPVKHSLSPVIHNAWIAAAGLDAVYAPFAAAPDGFERLVEGLRGGVRGLNVTVPFKERALVAADRADEAASRAGAANLLLFHENGSVEARNTDGLGLLDAFRRQAPGWAPAQGPVTVLGAGGAARGAAAALLGAGAPEVRLVNRTLERAEALKGALGAGVVVFGEGDGSAFADVSALVNATTVGLGGGVPAVRWSALPPDAVVMDMVYHPLRTELLHAAAARGHPAVDGVAMLIGQARPSFEAFFDAPAPPPEVVDVRALCLRALGETT